LVYVKQNARAFGSGVLVFAGGVVKSCASANYNESLYFVVGLFSVALLFSLPTCTIPASIWRSATPQKFFNRQANTWLGR
jgi:hypothetical protein